MKTSIKVFKSPAGLHSLIDETKQGQEGERLAVGYLETLFDVEQQAGA